MIVTARSPRTIARARKASAERAFAAALDARAGREAALADTSCDDHLTALWAAHIRAVLQETADA